MAASTSPSFQNVGFVAKPGEDIFPTTGPHLDVRVLKDGQYIDPEQWMPSYTITSGYGKRAAPTKGASTYHLGQDYGIPGGTELAWEGPGSFTPGRGYGSIKTTDAQGTPYEIRLLHTIGGKEFNQQAAQQAQQVAQQETEPGDTYIFMQPPSAQASASHDFLSLYVDELMKNRESAKIQSMINPAQMLMSAFNQTPNYLA
jgi:hypothetical protein